MTQRLFLYIDILGFKNLIEDGADIAGLYETINDLNVHNDNDFTCIVFSDTIVVYGSELWFGAINQGIMWLIEFAQDLFYRLIVKDIHFRAYVTIGEFEHYKLENLEVYYGEALVKSYEREKEFHCVGVFLDPVLKPYCDIFVTTPFSENALYVHVMQHLADISFEYDYYPVSGEYLEAIGMEWWVAYLIRYLENIHRHRSNEELSPYVRKKYDAAWNMISDKHAGLLRRLAEANFVAADVVQMDWTEPFARIGTEEGSWG